jgi:hypothetical protein
MLRIVKNQSPRIIIFLLLVAPRAAFACSVCMGRSDDAATQGLNAAVLTLLGVLLLVLAGVVGSIAALIRRAIEHPMRHSHRPGGVVQ